MTALRISELAEKSGFAPGTLRYYETVGLLRPERDPNGYRRYRPEDLDRLRFVSRAKQLGLTLDTIAELVGLRDDGSCPPVRSRLSVLVEERLVETRHTIAELRAFEAELAALGDDLTSEEAPKTCGPGCGCLDRPVLEVESPTACTLDSAAAIDRVRDWDRLVRSASAAHSAGDRWWLRFPADPEVAAEVARLAAAEARCCTFFTFRLDVGTDAVELEVQVPPTARALAKTLFARGV